MENIEILHPNTDYENLILRWGNNKSLDFCSKDKDGDIYIDLINYDDCHNNMYLDQSQIKELIKFLNKQIINE
jgi:hypothetical protein